jgi:hypothetical protein
MAGSVPSSPEDVMTRSLSVRILVVLLLASSGGCFRVVNPSAAPAPTPLASEANLNTLIQRAVATQKDSCQWQQNGTTAGSGSGPTTMTAHTELTASLQCRPEVLDKVLRALKAEVEKEAQAAGVQVHDPSEVVKDGRLESFGFEYAAGRLRGQLKAGVESDAGAAEHSYKLKVRIDEKAP